MTKARTLASFDSTGVLTSASTLNPAKLDDTGTIPSALLAGVGGGTNTPLFHAYGTGGYQAIPNATPTTVNVSNERFDSDDAFNTSTKRFTPQTAGKYFVYGNIARDGNWQAYARLYLAKNGNAAGSETLFNTTDDVGSNGGVHVSGIIEMNGSTDWIELMVRQDTGNSFNLLNSGNVNYFGAYKIAE